MSTTLMTQTECESWLKSQMPSLYMLLGMSWWHLQSPLRVWISRADIGYRPALDVLENQLMVVHRLFPTEYSTWRGVLAHPDKFHGKLFEAHCITLIHNAGIRITQFEPQYQSVKRPDMEVEVKGQRVAVEFTSLRHNFLTKSALEAGIEQEEAFRMAFREIQRPYCIMLNVLPNLQVPSVVQAFREVFVKWFDNHADGDEETLDVIPGFGALNQTLTPGLPAAQIVPDSSASFVRVGGVTSIGIIQGNVKGLKNALETKGKQVHGNFKGMNVIAVDMGFRWDMSLGELAPSGVTHEPPPAVQKFFSFRTMRHVSGVHLSTVNIFSLNPVASGGD